MVARMPLTRLARAVVLTLVALTVAVLLTARPAAALGTPAEERMLRLINRVRVQHGENRLRMKPYLVRNARAHTADMANRGQWFHNDRLARQLSNRRWHTLGENVGYAGTVWSMHRWFMNSPVHRRNILDGDFERIGIGIARRGGTLWFTQVFTG